MMNSRAPPNVPLQGHDGEGQRQGGEQGHQGPGPAVLRPVSETLQQDGDDGSGGDNGQS
jgi:hypothetical protein